MRYRISTEVLAPYGEVDDEDRGACACGCETCAGWLNIPLSCANPACGDRPSPVPKEKEA